MGFGRFFHHIGTLCLVAALALLIVTDVTAPTTSLSMFTVTEGSTSIRFGTFGYCVQSASDYVCSDTKIGYSPADIILSTFTSADISDDKRNATTKLTKVMVLHPVATGLLFISLLFSFATNFFVLFMATLASGLAFSAATAALVVEFFNFAAIKAALHDASHISADFDVASWTILAAAASLLIATVLSLFTCCSGRRERRGYIPKTV